MLPTYRFIVRESHLDTFGHMNNAAYLQLFEEARWEVVTQRGYGLVEVQKWRKGPIILEVQLKFLAELKLREPVTITNEISPFQGKIAIISQKMLKEDQTVAAEIKLTTGFFDLESRKLIAPTPEWLYATGLS